MKVTTCLTRLLLVVSAALLAACERPSPTSVQHGYRGTGMVQVYNDRTLDEKTLANILPVALPAASTDGPTAGKSYQNVKVLGHLSVAQFNRLMVSMTTWIAPNEGCAYCHNVANYAEDTKYTKVVARRMVEMTQAINGEWKTHVAETGVTCYTCHRGNHIPQQVWFKQEPQNKGADFIGDRAEQNRPDPKVGLSSLPGDPFSPYLLAAQDIRVNGATALPNNNRHSTKQAEWTYGLMEHMSSGLGVNCTYCHNTQSFSSWEGSTPQRATAWYGIRMARAVNNDYMVPLTATFPDNRLGPTGDVGKVNCATCHNGAYKPLNGQQMLKDFPELHAPAKNSASAEKAEVVVAKK